MDNLKERLKSILKERSILRGDFVLSSGKKSSYYIDARTTTLDPEGVNLIAKIMLEEILKHEGVDAVGGPTLGADPIVGALISYSWERKTPLRGFLVRKSLKQHGRGRLIEGNLKSGDKVFMVEDVVTTGGSVLNSIASVEREGAFVLGVLCVVNRRQKDDSCDFLEMNGKKYRLYSIFHIEELL